MKKVILHIGTAKTGTTYIQKTLAHNRKILRCSEISYHQIPGSLCSCHWWFAIHFLENIEDFSPVRIDLARGVERENLVERGKKSLLCIQSELESSQIVILSAEQFFGLASDALKRMRSFFVTLQADVQVIVYVRDPLDLASSIINQEVKMGLGDLKTFLVTPTYFKTKKQIEKYASIFGRENIHVKNYTEIKEHQDDLVDDFMNTFTSGFPTHELVREESLNKSISYEALIVIDEFNKLFTNYPPHSFERDLLIDVLSKVHGRKLSIPENSIKQLKAFVSEELDYLSKTHDIEFNDTAFRAHHPEIDPAYDSTLRSFAVVIHSLIRRIDCDKKASN